MLEVTRHVNVGPELIRPMTERLTGKRVITSYFDSNPDKESLARAARELMQKEAGEGRSYSAVGSRWIESASAPPGSPEILQRPAATKTIEMRMAELHARVVLLAAVQEGLLMRLARVESRLMDGAPSSGWSERTGLPASYGERPRQGAALDHAGEVREVSAAPEPSYAAAAAETRAEASPRPTSSDETVAATPGVVEAAEPVAVEPSRPNPSVPERAPLILPPVAELARCMALLIGGDLSVEEGAPLAVNRTTRDGYGMTLLDQADRTVGLIFMDLEATVFLGGTLMMLPRAELEQQLAAVAPGEDSIAASAEICHALTAAINDSRPQGVRASNLEKFDFRRASWVTDPADRRDLEDSFGGHTVIFARRVEAPVG